MQCFKNHRLFMRQPESEIKIEIIFDIHLYTSRIIDISFIYGYIAMCVYVCGEVASFIFTAKYLML